MIFWLSIIGILIIAFIIGLIIEYKNRNSFSCLGFGISLISGILTFIIGVVVLCSRLEYNRFERQFEIQRAMFNQIAASEEVDNVYKIFDMIESNTQLAELQSDYLYYGKFCVIPERVMDIKPIGAEE